MGGTTLELNSEGVPSFDRVHGSNGISVSELLAWEVGWLKRGLLCGGVLPLVNSWRLHDQVRTGTTGKRHESRCVEEHGLE